LATIVLTVFGMQDWSANFLVWSKFFLYISSPTFSA
jgi:hypothetical protein